MTTITEPGVYCDLSNEDYHLDPVPGGSLSASGAKTILKAPARFRYEQQHPVYKNVFDFGSVAHALALGDDTVNIVRLDFPDRRTKDYKTAEAEARALGSVPILRKDYAVIEDMVIALQDNTDAMDLLTIPGKPEQSAFWQDERTGIWRRARFDRLPNSDAPVFVIVDYKTAASADPDDFARTVASYGYHMQAAWYCDAARALDLNPDPAFAFVVQEKDPPYIATVIQLVESATDLASQQNAKAIDRYIECKRTDTWPGYASGVTHIELPGYYAATEREKVA